MAWYLDSDWSVARLLVKVRALRESEVWRTQISVTQRPEEWLSFKHLACWSIERYCPPTDLTTVPDLSGTVASRPDSSILIYNSGCRSLLRAREAGPRVPIPAKAPPRRRCWGRLGLFPGAMADLKLLVPELNEAEAMGAETARFQELLLQVRTDQGLLCPWLFGGFFPRPPMGLQFPECTREGTGLMGIVVG